MVGKHDNNFFPYNTSLIIVDIVNLVKNDELNISNDISTSVEH